MNSIALSGSLTVNIILLGLMDSFANLMLVFITPRFPRRLIGFCTFTLSGAFILLVGLLHFFDFSSEYVQAFTLLGKMSVSMAFSTVYIFTGELYPTSTRGSAYAICVFVSSSLSITLPFIIDQGKTWEWMPGLIISILSFIAALSRVSTVFLVFDKLSSIEAYTSST